MILKKTTLSVVASIAVIAMIGLNGCGDSKGSSQTSGSSSSSSGSSGQPQEKISTITAVDGFVIGTFNDGLSVTVDGKTYKSEKQIGQYGVITFKGVDIKQGTGIIVVPKGAAKIDSDNDGKLSKADKDLPIEMSAPSTASVISPLTTLLVQMKAEDVDIPAGFEAAVLNFNPVTQVTKNDALSQKLIVLNEVLKTAMAVVTPAEFVKIDVAGLMKAKTLKDLNIDTLVAKLPDSIKAKAGAKAKIIKSLLPIASGLKPGVNFETLIVAISDGGQTLQQAFHTAAPTLVASDSVSLSDIASSVMVSGLKSTSVTYITNVITTVNTSTVSVQSENYTAVVEVAPEPIEKEPTSSSSSSSSSSSTSGSSYVPPVANPVLTVTKASFGNKDVTISGTTMSSVEINTTKSDENNLTKFFDIDLTDGLTTSKSFTSTNAKLDIKLVDDANTSKYVEITVSDVKLEATAPSTFKTTIPTSSVIKIVDNVNGSSTKTGSLSTEVSTSDLSFNFQSILDKVNPADKPNVDSSINTMNSYFLSSPNGKDFTITTTLSGTGFDTLTISGPVKVVQ